MNRVTRSIKQLNKFGHELMRHLLGSTGYLSSMEASTFPAITFTFPIQMVLA